MQSIIYNKSKALCSVKSTLKRSMIAERQLISQVALTHILSSLLFWSISAIFSLIFSVTSAQLHHHPDLQGVWGDLTESFHLPPAGSTPPPAASGLHVLSNIFMGPCSMKMLQVTETQLSKSCQPQ